MKDSITLRTDVLKDTLTVVTGRLESAKGIATRLKKDLDVPSIQRAPGTIHNAQASIESLVTELKNELT